MRTSGREVTGRTLHPGSARGEALLLGAPLSLWGGTDGSGRIVDGHHPQCGTRLTGRVVVLASGRGSSSSSAVLAEQVRTGTAPAAIVLSEVDPIMVAGALVAAELYGTLLPIVQVAAGRLDRTRGVVEVEADPSTMTATVTMEEP